MRRVAHAPSYLHEPEPPCLRNAKSRHPVVLPEPRNVRVALTQRNDTDGRNRTAQRH